VGTGCERRKWAGYRYRRRKHYWLWHRTTTFFVDTTGFPVVVANATRAATSAPRAMNVNVQILYSKYWQHQRRLAIGRVNFAERQLFVVTGIGQWQTAEQATAGQALFGFNMRILAVVANP